jgi:hypothetical protein
MPLLRSSDEASLIDVLDRVLDKGIVVDAWARVSRLGIDLTGSAIVAVIQNELEVLETPERKRSDSGAVPALRENSRTTAARAAGIQAEVRSRRKGSG